MPDLLFSLVGCPGSNLRPLIYKESDIHVTHVPLRNEGFLSVFLFELVKLLNMAVDLCPLIVKGAARLRDNYVCAKAFARLLYATFTIYVCATLYLRELSILSQVVL